jgi:hypothetical protein
MSGMLLTITRTYKNLQTCKLFQFAPRVAPSFQMLLSARATHNSMKIAKDIAKEAMPKRECFGSAGWLGNTLLSTIVHLRAVWAWVYSVSAG